ncbi:transglycosylase SLT domain-containing protein [Halopseudomonas pachastrellae]|nr:transglycosylase SLT domain-containing protein [Halopseudomonas pachastrellae]
MVRRPPRHYASTGAALDYLTLLNGYFDGDWLLALAAYNCGEGCVGRAIKRNEALGLPTDYWNLQLPRETMNYVPKLLALAQIVDSPTAYGTVLPSLANEPYFAGVAIDQQIDLHKVAELADLSTDELLSLNPAFNQRVTAPNGEYQLLIPVDHVEQFTAALASLPANERVNYQHYRCAVATPCLKLHAVTSSASALFVISTISTATCCALARPSCCQSLAAALRPPTPPPAAWPAVLSHYAIAFAPAITFGPSPAPTAPP